MTNYYFVATSEMTITLLTAQDTTTASVRIVPFVKNAHFHDSLAAFAQQHGLAKTLLANDFKAEWKENLVVYTSNNQKIYLLGLGEKATFGETQAAFRSLIFQQKARLSSHIAVDFTINNSNDLQKNNNIEAAVAGLLLGRYDIGSYKTEKKPVTFTFQSTQEITIDCIGDHIDQKTIDRARAVAETQLRILDLVNAPANIVSPQTLGKWAKESGEKHGFSAEILDLPMIVQKGLHALIAVSKGAAADPAFLILEYKPSNNLEKLPTIGLVGKGVTFDTGGISLKDSGNMHYMKSDMGGAAAVLGAIEVAAKLQLPVHFVATIPTTENCIDGNATKPGDIIGSYLGKSIEVIDTDAEGRLILADGIAYLNQNFRPDVLIDLATLTGSVVRTLGYAAAGLFSNNDELAAKLALLGEQCGERLWRLPLWEAYADDIKSDVADLRNFSGKPTAGAISAAKFLEVFTENHPAWAHLDIAGTAFTDSEFATQKSATGYGVRLLTEYLSSFGQ